MKIPCDICNGLGTIQDESKAGFHTCGECDNGDVIRCVSTAPIPKHWKHHDAIMEIQADAVKSKNDHKRLCEINPRAKESYDSQLGETLKKLNSMADSLSAGK